MKQMSYHVIDYGAVGDGKTKDTNAIQRAIDACAAAGGGTVYVPAGRFLTGTLYLKSYTELHLSAGATLIGSSKREDYNEDHIFAENQPFKKEEVTGAHLIIAYKQTNVSITGEGTIDGNSGAFFGPLADGATASYRFKDGNFPIKSWRPGQMLYFCLCTQVAVRNVSLLNSTYWTLLLHGCQDVQLHGLLIENPPATRNGDGIDIDCSRHVTVSDCIIRTGDDCITLRGNKAPLGEYAQPCEHVVVTNCILSTPCNAIRIGVGNGEIRHCSFQNIIVKQSSRAISVISSYAESSHGTCIEQIDFSDFIIDAMTPLVIAAGPGASSPGAIRDLRFSRFTISATAGSQIVGKPHFPIQRIQLTDFDWHIKGGAQNDAFVHEMPSVLSHHGYVGINDRPALPAVLYGLHVKDLALENMRVRWSDPSHAWRYGFFFENCDDITLYRAQLRQPLDDKGASVYCQKSGGKMVLHHCEAKEGTNVFLQVENSSEGTSIRAIGNDLVAATKAFISDVPVREAHNLYRVC